MRSRASNPGLARALALALALVAGLSSCRKDRVDPPAPDAQAPGAELAPGALMLYTHGGGHSGKTSHVTVFADGHVVGRASHKTAGTDVRLPVARVEKLSADLAATGIFAEKDGSWVPSRPAADGSGGQLVLRDSAGAVHSYEWSSGAKAPDAVARAMEVGGTFAREFAPDKPCACQAGDPLCSCL